MQYVWDARKRQFNLVKHGLDFADAEIVFEGPTFTYEDDRYNYGEQRWITLGFLKGVLVAIAHTETPSEIRIISMRRGTKYEQSIFFENL
ncbi:MAG: hypothetical protein B0A82_03310 [Alkalinema sp. CACIAM 70d]|nr:MAG: hypothetical protein B0A82_03310 [Alkalinema sp. CACIAM 70d]